MNETIDSVIRYWFGEASSSADINAEKKRLWWSKNEKVDEKIADRFSALIDAVASGELDHWNESDNGLLASIICTDQFPRNIYRGHSKSFSYDQIALRFARQAIAMGFDRKLSLIKRVFIYMPFEHSEEISDQQQAVSLMQSLVEQSSTDEKDVFAGWHHEVIAEFGRFPHRNAILGRESTEKELVFLKKPGSSF